MEGNVTGKKIVGTVSGGYSINGGLGVVYGKDGKSAYEIAVNHGFEGTEEEWLASLNGKDGIDGVDGKDGVDGTNGKDGYTPVKGVDYFDGAKGDKGEKGDPGIYLGTGDMPDGYCVQIDPNGEVDTIESIAQTAARLVLNTGADAIEGTANGAVVSVSDSSSKSLMGLSLYGKTTQDGTPAPTDRLDDSYIPLINAGKNGNVGVSIYGKNLFNNDTSLIGQVSVTKSDGSTRNYWGRAVSLPAGIYTISARTTSTNIMYLYGCTNKKDGTYGQECKLWQNQTYKGPHTITVEDGDTLYFYEGIGYSGEAVRNIFAVFDIQIEVGTSVTAFEPYKVPQTMTINTPDGLCGKPVDNGGNYTDENGQQWVCDEIDLARGVYIKRIHTVDFSKGEWVEEFSDSLGEDGDFWGSIFRLSDNAQMVAAKEGMPVLCSHINWASGLSESAYTSDGINVHADYMIISLGDFPQEILEELAENSVKVQYVMATPEEIPLSAEELEAYAALHTNKPNTTIVNNGGANMALIYVADTKTYIDNKFKELAIALVANS